jgi:hypothetical protein
MNTTLKTALVASAFALAGAGFATGAQAAGPTVRLDHLVARVIVIPEARNTINAEVRNSGRGGLAKPTLTVTGDEMTVSGGVSNSKLHSCHVRGGGHGVSFGLFNHVSEDDLPVITIRTPMSVNIVADGAVEGEVGASHALSLSQKRCGAWKVGDVADKFEYDLEGMGDVNAGAVGSTVLRLEGMGDIRIKSTGALDAGMQGMGDVVVEQVNGPVHASLQGMGDLKIRGGHATEFTASLEGMGDIHFEGVADTVDASAQGMGDITIAKATGEVHKSQSGFSQVKVGK